MEFTNNIYNYKVGDDRIIESNLIINWNAVIDLSGNSSEFYKSIFQMFLEELKQILLYIKLSKNIIDLRRQLHQLKGTASNLGLYLLSCCANYYNEELKLNKLNYSNELIIEIIDNITEIKNITEMEFKNNVHIKITK